MLNGGHLPGLGGGGAGVGSSLREQRRPMWTQHEKTVLRLLMREYAGVTEFDPPDIHKHPIKNEMWRLLTARYNDHPNVRTRDTKQLRKAWENLKYRARKLGNDSKRSTTQRGPSTTSLHDVFDASWPLDGVSLALGGIREIESPEGEDDSKSVILEEELKGHSSWGDHSKTTSRVSESEGNSEGPRAFDGSLKGTREDLGKFGALGGGDFSSRGRNAVLSLQPLVTSLVGGALPALLPFLSPPSHPPLPPDLFAGNPFTHAFLPQAEECTSEPSLSKEDVGRPSLPRSGSSLQAWSSKEQKEADSPLHRLKAEIKEEDFSSDPDEDLDEPVGAPGTPGRDSPIATASANVSRLLLRRAREEQQHMATLQLLRTQLSHAETQHEIKMKLLEAQLEYWQKKLKLQQESGPSNHDNENKNSES